jgi:hypothetical protein
MRPETSFLKSAKLFISTRFVGLGTCWPSLFFAQKEKAATHHDAQQERTKEQSSGTAVHSLFGRQSKLHLIS